MVFAGAEEGEVTGPALAEGGVGIEELHMWQGQAGVSPNRPPGAAAAVDRVTDHITQLQDAWVLFNKAIVVCARADVTVVVNQEHGGRPIEVEATSTTRLVVAR